MTEFRGTFFAAFFPNLFFLNQGENTPVKKKKPKKTRRNSVKENSSKVRGKYQSARMLEKLCKATYN